MNVRQITNPHSLNWRKTNHTPCPPNFREYLREPGRDIDDRERDLGTLTTLQIIMTPRDSPIEETVKTIEMFNYSAEALSKLLGFDKIRNPLDLMKLYSFLSGKFVFDENWHDYYIAVKMLDRGLRNPEEKIKGNCFVLSALLASLTLYFGMTPIHIHLKPNIQSMLFIPASPESIQETDSHFEGEGRLFIPHGDGTFTFCFHRHFAFEEHDETFTLAGFKQTQVLPIASHVFALAEIMELYFSSGDAFMM
jgi:hypothetical protein